MKTIKPITFTTHLQPCYHLARWCRRTPGTVAERGRQVQHEGHVPHERRGAEEREEAVPFADEGPRAYVFSNFYSNFWLIFGKL